MERRREARKRKHFLELYSCLITKLSSCHRVTLLCCVVHCLISPLLKMPVIKKVRIFNRPTLNTMLFISSLSPISLSLHLVPTQQGQGKAQVMYWLWYTVTSSYSSSCLTDWPQQFDILHWLNLQACILKFSNSCSGQSLVAHFSWKDTLEIFTFTLNIETKTKSCWKNICYPKQQLNQSNTL